MPVPVACLVIGTGRAPQTADTQEKAAKVFFNNPDRLFSTHQPISPSPHPTPTRLPIAATGARDDRRRRIEHATLDRPPDPLHAHKSAFHGGWVDLARVLLDTPEQAARKMPQPYEFDPGHEDGIRHADLDAGERVLNEIIHECQRSLEGIGHARLDLEARSWARGMGLRE